MNWCYENLYDNCLCCNLSYKFLGVLRGGKTAEATAALASLGYSQAEIGAALKGIDVEALRVEDIVRQALRAMVSK